MSYPADFFFRLQGCATSCILSVSRVTQDHLHSIIHTAPHPCRDYIMWTSTFNNDSYGWSDTSTWSSLAKQHSQLLLSLWSSFTGFHHHDRYHHQHHINHFDDYQHCDHNHLRLGQTFKWRSGVEALHSWWRISPDGRPGDFFVFCLFWPGNIFIFCVFDQVTFLFVFCHFWPGGHRFLYFV